MAGSQPRKFAVSSASTRGLLAAVLGFQEVIVMTVFSGLRLALCIFGPWLCRARHRPRKTWTWARRPAQLFASDCAICHKSPAALSKAGGLFGMESFLRQHYTASRRIRGRHLQLSEGLRRRAGWSRQKGLDQEIVEGRRQEAGEKKPDGSVTLPGDNKPVEAKPADTKASEVKAHRKAGSAQSRTGPQSEIGIGAGD